LTGGTAADIGASELHLEQAVSQYIGAMPFLFIDVDDDAGPNSARGRIERNAIALLSNYQRPPIDLPGEGWLGQWSGRERVQQSGLWNNNHVDESCEEGFLELLSSAVQRTLPLLPRQ
jgi:hypothetical protein